MFEADPVDVISKGNLDKLKKMLKKNPGLLNREINWKSKYGGHSGYLLHVAASFNQTEIIKFLVNENGMDVSQPNIKTQRTPLHYASEQGCLESASLLFFELGADPTLRCNAGTNGFYKTGTPYEVCSDERIKALLLPAYEAQMKQEEPERLAREAERLAQERAKAEARIAGTWTLNPASEIVHEYEQWGEQNQYRVMDKFNFAAGRFTSIFEKMDSGSLSHQDIFFKAEDIAHNPTLSEAFAKLQELTGKAGPDAGAKEAVPVRQGGLRLIRAGEA